MLIYNFGLSVCNRVKRKNLQILFLKSILPYIRDAKLKMLGLLPLKVYQFNLNLILTIYIVLNRQKKSIRHNENLEMK